MKKPLNRLAKVETLESVAESEHPGKAAAARTPEKCPKCGSVTLVVSELMRNNRVIRQRRCGKCNVIFTEAE
jgi:phage FluMu protein Com